MLRGLADAGVGVVGVPGGLQLGGDARGEPVAGADRGDQSAGDQFAEGGVGVGVADQGGQVRLVRHLPAERDGEPQGGAGGGAEPGGEQRGGRGGLAEGGQRDLVAVGGVVGRLVGPYVLEDAELVDGAGAGPQPVALAQQGARLDEAQRQALGLEPQVPRPGGLLVGEGAADGVPEQVESCRAVEARQLDVLDAGVGGGVGHVRGGGEQEGALGGGVQQFVEGGPAELQVVQDDDGADLADALQQFVPVGAVQGRVEDRVEEVVEEVVGAAAVAVEADHSVGREIGAVLRDDVEQPGAAGAAGADESHGAASGEQPYQRLPLVLTGQQGQRRLRGARGDGRGGGTLHLGALGLGEPAGAGGPLGGRAGLDLAAVDGVDGQQEVPGDELHRAGGHGRVLSEVGGEGFPGRALARRVAAVAVLLGSRVVRVHRS